MALNHHPNLTLNHLHTATNDASSSSSSSRSSPLQDDQGVLYAQPFIESKHSLYPHEVVGDVVLGRNKEMNDLNFKILKSYNQDHHIHTSSSPTTTLKMRFSQKSMTSNYYQRIDDQNSKRVDYSPRESNGENSINNNNESCGLIRACSDCGTTRTPLWRSGPHGPKSLCNACGIRQRKARRAAMAASDSTTCATNSSSNNNNNTTKLNLSKEMAAPKIMKKRSKNNHARKTLTPNHDDHDNQRSTHQTKKISFQEFTLNLSKNLALHQFFQQDEKEAAILLMALSCGFVEG